MGETGRPNWLQRQDNRPTLPEPAAAAANGAQPGWTLVDKRAMVRIPDDSADRFPAVITNAEYEMGLIGGVGATTHRVASAGDCAPDHPLRRRLYRLGRRQELRQRTGSR